MEARNNQLTADDSGLAVGTGTKQPEKKRRRQEPLENEDIQQQQLVSYADEDSLNFVTEQVRNLQQKLSDLNVEVENVKTVDKQEMNRLIAKKVTEATGLLREKFSKQMEQIQQKFAEQLEELVTKKVAEERHKLRKEFLHNEAPEKQPQSSGQQHEVVNMMEENPQKKSQKFVWNANRWDISDHFQVVGEDGLVASCANADEDIVNVCAQLPISRAILASSFPGQKFVYFEVKLDNSPPATIGWIGPEFPLKSRKFLVGNYPGSYAIAWGGDYWKSGTKVANFADGFKSGDVVGSGLLLTRDGRIKLFFTKNGRMNGKPIPLYDGLDLLYPAVSFYWKNTSIEANFGADTEKKPFKFDIEAHKVQLFV